MEIELYYDQMLLAAMLLWNDNLHKLLGGLLLRDLD
jgi:hypothetical protein